MPDLCAERSLGHLSIPELITCGEEELCIPCSFCGCTEWQPSQHKQKSLVFLPAEIVEIEFQSCACLACQSPNCAGILHADGKHQGIFRKRSNLAFTHEVMYQWAKIGPGSPNPWSSAWRDHLIKLMGHSQKQPEWWNKLKKAFSEATMDFIRLQHLDYGAGFRCECSECEPLLLSAFCSTGLTVYCWLDFTSFPQVRAENLDGRTLYLLLSAQHHMTM